MLLEKEKCVCKVTIRFKPKPIKDARPRIREAVKQARELLEDAIATRSELTDFQLPPRTGSLSFTAPDAITVVKVIPIHQTDGPQLLGLGLHCGYGKEQLGKIALTECFKLNGTHFHAICLAEGFLLANPAIVSQFVAAVIEEVSSNHRGTGK